MSINTLRPEELIKFRKLTSDAKNNTDDLTFNSGSNNTRAAAYKRNREIKDELLINRLGDDSTYYDELLED